MCEVSILLLLSISSLLKILFRVNHLLSQYSYLIYKNGMDGGQFGFQSANAVLFFFVIVAISVFQMTVMNKKEEQ